MKSLKKAMMVLSFVLFGLVSSAHATVTWDPNAQYACEVTCTTPGSWGGYQSTGGHWGGCPSARECGNFATEVCGEGNYSIYYGPVGNDPHASPIQDNAVLEKAISVEMTPQEYRSYLDRSATVAPLGDR